MQTLRFKHLFGEAIREKYEQIQPANYTNDGALIGGNAKYTGLLTQGGGGNILILENGKQRKMQATAPQIRGHTGTILDFEFYPFNDQFLASASMDSTVKLWQVPQEFKQDLTECVTTLNGHTKKVNLLNWHPSAQFILATTAFDSTIRVWDVQKSESLFEVVSPAQYSTALQWRTDGSLIGSLWHDKQLRITDPRTGQFSHQVQTHQGSKPQKFSWLSEDYLFTIGFNKATEREFFIWDIKNLTEPVQKKTIDSQSSILYPYFDSDLNVLYLAGKGEAVIKFFEFNSGTLTYLSDYFSNVPAKAYAFLPKKGNDILKCEVQRVAKLGGDFVEYIQIIVPRKTQIFQDDIFPPTAGKSSLTADEWKAGQNALAGKVSLKPDAQGTVQLEQEKPVEFVQKAPVQQEQKTVDVKALQQRLLDVEHESQEKDHKIKELEEELTQLKLQLESQTKSE